MTSSTRTTRRRRDRPRSSVTAVRGVIIIALGGALILGLLQLYNGIPTTNYRYVNASLPTIGNLLPHDFVRIAGKRVGQVHEIGIGDDGRPRIRLQLDPGTKLPADTQVRVRANGLLGARYVELIPGRSADILSEDATIRGGPNAYSYGLPEVLETFDPATRQGLEDTVNNLGQGLLGNGPALNDTVGDFAYGSKIFDDVVSAVLARDGAADRLLPGTASAFRALDPTAPQVDDLLSAANQALRPLATERDALRATIERAPPALDSAFKGLSDGRRLVGAVRRLSGELNAALPPAPEGLRQLAGLLDESQRPLRRAEPLLSALRSAIPPTLDTLGALMPVVPRARQAVDGLRPILHRVGVYGCDIANTGAVMRSMTGFRQPGTGPLGPAKAFRLQVVTPSGLDVAGIDEPTLKRAAYQAPCASVSKPYPQTQFIPSLEKGAPR